MELLGAGREAEVFAVNDDECLKLFYEGRPDRLIEREANIMRRVSELPIPSPKFLGVINRDGRKGILMQRLHGKSMLAELLEHPENIDTYGEKVGRIQRAYHALSGEGFQSMSAHIFWAIEKTDLLSEEEKRELLARFSLLDDGDRLLHTDYHADNLMIVGEDIYIIDWSGASFGNPMADAARTLLTCGAGTYPVYATPEICANLDNARAVLRASYLRGYGAEESAFAEWLPIIAAARLYCAPTEEIEVNLKIIRKSLAQ